MQLEPDPIMKMKMKMKIVVRNADSENLPVLNCMAEVPCSYVLSASRNE